MEDYTAVFCPYIHIQARASLLRKWLEDEWGGINGSVSGVQYWYSLPSRRWFGIAGIA